MAVSRELKRRITTLLESDDPDKGIARIAEIPARRAINPLLSLFLSPVEQIRWRAITASGILVARLAESEPESARVIMRRLMWMLNDESGGIGWGVPEAFGAILANSPLLTREFATILASYADPRRNFLEHPVLQQGLLWGLCELGRSRPDPAREAAPHVARFLESDDPVLCGLAARFLASVPFPDALPMLRDRKQDDTAVRFWEDGRMTEHSVGRLAAAAAAAITDFD